MNISPVSPNPWASESVAGPIDSPAEAVATWINENQISDLTALSRSQIMTLLEKLQSVNESTHVPGLGELITNLQGDLANQPTGGGGTDILDLRLAVLNTLSATTNNPSNPLALAASEIREGINSLINDIVLDLLAGADAEFVLEDD